MRPPRAIDQECRALSAGDRAEAARQVRGTARQLSVALLDPAVAQRFASKALDGQHTCEPGLGVPTKEHRLEFMRTALLEVRDLHGRHGIPCQAMPELTIPASRADLPNSG
jgi:hypothetical protein